MGCDIHMVLEKKHKNNWVGLYEVKGEARNRNYSLFYRLAGVRGYNNDLPGPEPKGVPEDASALSNMSVDEWDGDGHSHSYCTLREFTEAYAATALDREALAALVAKRMEGGGNIYENLYHQLFDIYLGDRNDTEDLYRLVFWFDN